MALTDRNPESTKSESSGKESIINADIAGNWASVLLPILPNDTIDFHRLNDQVDYLISSGVNGIYTNGSAGEFYAQTEAEFEEVQIMVAEKCVKSGLPFIIGASHMSAQISLSRIQRTLSLRPLAYQVILPEWFPVTLEEANSFLARIAECTEIGVILYNPPCAKITLSPEEFGQLKRSNLNLQGIKVAGGDRGWYSQINQHCMGLAVFVPGHDLATGLLHGAAGSFSNVATLSPFGSQRWYERMQTDYHNALELEQRIKQFMDRYIMPFISQFGYTNAAVDKLLAVIGDWQNIGTRVRWPYRSIPMGEAEQLRSIAKDLLPELFEFN